MTRLHGYISNRTSWSMSGIRPILYGSGIVSQRKLQTNDIVMCLLHFHLNSMLMSNLRETVLHIGTMKAQIGSHICAVKQAFAIGLTHF